MDKKTDNTMDTSKWTRKTDNTMDNSKRTKRQTIQWKLVSGQKDRKYNGH
jgi:hypothetical protein